MFFDEGRIVIDESLDPEENPAKGAHYRFRQSTRRHRANLAWAIALRLHRYIVYSGSKL
jgi:hypothetical protein